MALLHQKSPECTLVKLEHFTAPTIKLSTKDKTNQDCQSLSALSDSSPIEFFIPGDGKKYTSAGKNY